MDYLKCQSGCTFPHKSSNNQCFPITIPLKISNKQTNWRYWKPDLWDTRTWATGKQEFLSYHSQFAYLYMAVHLLILEDSSIPSSCTDDYLRIDDLDLEQCNITISPLLCCWLVSRLILNFFSAYRYVLHTVTCSRDLQFLHLKCNRQKDWKE